MSVDVNDPNTWSYDDPALWLHAQWYRKNNSIPDTEEIPGYPQPPPKKKPLFPTRSQTPKVGNASFRSANKMVLIPETPSFSQTENSSFRSINGMVQIPEIVISSHEEPATYRIAGKDVTKEELLHRLRNVERSVSEVYNMNKNGDSLEDQEQNWWEQYKEFLDDPADIDEDDPFTLWNAKQHCRMDLLCERKLASQQQFTCDSSSGSAAQTKRPGHRNPPNLKDTYAGRKIQKTGATGLKEIKKDMQRVSEILTVLEEEVSKLQKECYSGELKKYGVARIKTKIEGVLKEVKMLKKRLKMEKSYECSGR